MIYGDLYSLGFVQVFTIYLFFECLKFRLLFGARCPSTNLGEAFRKNKRIDRWMRLLCKSFSFIFHCLEVTSSTSFSIEYPSLHRMKPSFFISQHLYFPLPMYISLFRKTFHRWLFPFVHFKLFISLFELHLMLFQFSVFFFDELFSESRFRIEIWFPLAFSEYIRGEKYISLWRKVMLKCSFNFHLKSFLPFISVVVRIFWTPLCKFVWNSLCFI